MLYYCKPILKTSIFIGLFGSKKDHKNENLRNGERRSGKQWKEEPGFNIDNVTNQREAVAIINDYEEFIKTKNKKTISYVAEQGQILKNFRDMEDVTTKNMGVSRSIIYFKIRLYKVLKKSPI